MPRAVLTGRQRIGRDAAPYAAFVPAATVVAASLLAALPIVSTSGWYPDFGYMVLISCGCFGPTRGQPGGQRRWASSTTCSPDIR